MLTLYEVLGLFGTSGTVITPPVTITVNTPQSRTFRLGDNNLASRTFGV